jgi:cation diffusion facilitator CzcD-associated flavoprotein CzcO
LVRKPVIEIPLNASLVDEADLEKTDILGVPVVRRTTSFTNIISTDLQDVPAHSYQLSFESSTDWNNFYAGAPEILKYWKNVAEKYRLRRLMRFGNKCLGAQWNETTSKWHVKFLNDESGSTFEDIGDVLMTGVGMLNSWKWPDIKGLHDFRGTLLHSADWDTSFDATVSHKILPCALY